MGPAQLTLCVTSGQQTYLGGLLYLLYERNTPSLPVWVKLFVAFKDLERDVIGFEDLRKGKPSWPGANDKHVAVRCESAHRACEA